MMNRDRRLWTPLEDKAIVQLVNTYGNKNWAFISAKMSQNYNIQYRSGKQCRERWINHLNPDINKDKWSEQQEVKVFEHYLCYGNKWKQISQHFPGRTDNCIKNHFYSTLRRSLRRINKFVGIRNSTEKMREIKPSILSKMLDNTMISEQVGTFKDFAEILSEFSTFKPNKDNIGIVDNLIIKKYKKNITEVLTKINELNQNYSKEKQIKPTKKRRQIRSVKKKVKIQQPTITKQQNLSSSIVDYLKEQYLSQQQLEQQEQQNNQQEQELNYNPQQFLNNSRSHCGFRKIQYKLDQKSQKLECEIDQYNDDESYFKDFKDLQIVGKAIKLTEVQATHFPVQDGQIFEMLFHK